MTHVLVPFRSARAERLAPWTPPGTLKRGRCPSCVLGVVDSGVALTTDKQKASLP